LTLRDVARYHAWLDREQPSADAQRVAAQFLIELTDRPYTAPSIPVEELSGRPEFEVREVALRVPGGVEPEVWILYRLTLANGAVDVIDITRG
jgi:hypothetical protein